MSEEFYKLVNYEKRDPEQPVLAYGIHAECWDFERMGKPTFAFHSVYYDVVENELSLAERRIGTLTRALTVIATQTGKYGTMGLDGARRLALEALKEEVEK